MVCRAQRTHAQRNVRGCPEDSPTAGPQTAGETTKGNPMTSQPTQPARRSGNGAAPGPAWPVAAAAAARRQGQSRLRAATVTIGVAGLAAAGVVAYVLPGSSHASTSSSTGSGAAPQHTGSSAGTSTGSSGSSGSASNSGSAATGGSGFSGSSGISVAPGGGGQTTSGGS